MITYTQLYKEVADNCGFSPTTSSNSLTLAQRHINLALKKFKNASRRYWTRKEVTTNLVANQQYYTFPEDMVRITTVKATSGGLTMPITMIDSEELWNRINLVPSMTVGIPTQGFIRGRNELGLYPIPSTNYTNGLIVSYESRQKDMSIEDLTTATLNVTNGSVSIVASSGTPFNQNMVGQWVSITDGSDGNWYQITAYTDTTHISIENYYQGPTKSAVASIIASVPDIPEDYHQALIDYACYRYFLKRKDVATSADYKSLYQDALKDYKAVYAAKTTGVTQDDLTPYSYNLFNLPPQNVTA
jgi:hypothetical protein